MAFLKVFLRSAAGEVELSTDSLENPYRLLDGARGMGLPQRTVETTPIASGNGSVFRSQRFDETEMMFPISVRGRDASDVAENSRQLERILAPASDEPLELLVIAPDLGTTRRRYVYYTGGLEGSVGGQDSHWTWRHSPVTFLAPDPLWYGDERVVTKRVDAGRKPFITSKVEPAEEDPRRVPFFPVIIASSTVDGGYKLDIQGDAEAWPIWEITGPGEDLLIENVDTGERIFIQGEFGEKVTVDTRPTIADIYSETEDDGELWERVDDDYQLFPLAPGKNTVKITMVNARPDSTVTLRYSETWMAGW